MKEEKVTITTDIIEVYKGYLIIGADKNDVTKKKKLIDRGQTDEFYKVK